MSYLPLSLAPPLCFPIFSSNMSNKARMPAFTISIQHIIGSPSQGNKIKGKKIKGTQLAKQKRKKESYACNVHMHTNKTLARTSKPIKLQDTKLMYQN